MLKKPGDPKRDGVETAERILFNETLLGNMESKEGISS